MTTPPARICAKVARLSPSASITKTGRMHPLRSGSVTKGAGEFRAISWDDALDIVAEKLSTPPSSAHGAEK